MTLSIAPKKSALKTLALMGLSCAIAAGTLTSTASAQSWKPSKPVEFIAPANPGGGWDTLVRTAANVISQEGLADQNFAAINIPGGGGAVAWAQIARDNRNDHKLFATSPPIILVPLAGTSRFNHQDFRPIARLITDYSIVLVRADSPYQTVNQLFDGIKANQRLSVGGGSAAGSMDHIAIAGAAGEYGINPGSVNYIAFSGGGEAMTTLLGGHVEAVITGAGEAVSMLAGGQIRALAVSAPERIEGSLSVVPTFKEQGIDYTFDIWRGVMGPKDMPEAAVRYYEDLFARMMTTNSWKEATARLGWLDAYQNSADFGVFLDGQLEQFSSVLSDMGMLR